MSLSSSSSASRLARSPAPDLLPSARSAAIHSKDIRTYTPAPEVHAFSNRSSRTSSSNLSRDIDAASRASTPTAKAPSGPPPPIAPAASASASPPSGRAEHAAASLHHIRSKGNKHMDVVIHVYDESKNAKRDFYCQRALLLRQMTYFTAYLHAHSLDATVEIDVHCDIEVFEWLMSYISRKRPLFEPRIALSILISSNFLRMTALEDLCIRYIHENLDDVLKIPIDMGCLGEPLIEKLTKLFTIDELQKVKDPQDKVLNELFLGKLLEQLGALAAQKNAVCACRLCGKLYALAEEQNLMCTAGPVRIGLGGELLSPHESDASFDINEYLATSHSRGICWKDMYWM
ncbi:hypothetical protein HDU88_002421 [Geranomyces variabilis]|nr:hypothetical protein HDU88_002421 [Geranomyces variabilis]